MLACWAKLNHGEEPPEYHPLICHMIDVAMVAREMWRSALSDGLRREMARALGFEQDQDIAGLWCAFMAGLHDLGKASPAFQLQVERVRNEVAEQLRGIGMPLPPSYIGVGHRPHGAMTACTLPNILIGTFGLKAPAARRIGTVVGGHHGAFPTSHEIQSLKTTDIGRREWDDLRRDVAETASRHPPAAQQPARRQISEIPQR